MSDTQNKNLAEILHLHSLWLADNSTGLRVDLYGANLREANLYGANLREANLYGANLREANLRGANLREANLRGANLREADLYRANLREADLHGADLHGADLRGVDLHEADLRYTVGIIYAGQDLRGYQFFGTVNEDNVVLVHAGCHTFTGITAARTHWQSRHLDNTLLYEDCLSLVHRIEHMAKIHGWKLEPDK